MAARLPLLLRGHSKSDGASFVVVPASDGKTAHWTATDGSGCTCLGFDRRGTCAHAIAAQLVIERQRPTRPAEDVADHLARLQAELAERKRTLRLIGFLEGEEHEDPTYSKLLEQIERVSATLAEWQRIAA
jgi:hypothetical protein